MDNVKRRFYRDYGGGLGVYANARGLRVWHGLDFGHLFRWDEIQDVIIVDSGATVRTSSGDLWLGCDLDDWLYLASECQRAMGRDETGVGGDEAPGVSPEEVARWLGVSADGKLRCRSYFWRCIRSFLYGAAVYTAWTCLHVRYGSSFFWHGVLFNVFLFVWLFRMWRGRRISEIRATPTELDVRTDTGWRKYAWTGLRRVVRRDNYWVVNTVDGDLLLPPLLSSRETLLAAICQAIDARQRGFALPRMSADVPQAALSRAEGGEVSLERGLSQAEEGAEG
jgi:hypothetical protein